MDVFALAQDRQLILAASKSSGCLVGLEFLIFVVISGHFAQSKYEAAFIQTYAVFSEVILLY